MNTFAQRMAAVKPSPTVATSGKAKAMIAAGDDVVIFSSGEPDFDTAEHIKEAAIKALRDGCTKYTIVPGIAPLREAICTSIAEQCGAQYEPANVIVTCGAKQSLFATMQILLSPGDEVIIPAPHWVSYSDQALICDATPVIVPTSDADKFKVSAAALEAAITPRSKLVVLNNPNNPSGSCFTREELQAIAEVCERHGLWVISDEIYDAFAYPPAQFTSFLEVAPGHKDKTILISGVSKKYAMTGWRIGWTVGPESLIKKMCTWQGQVVSHATNFAQHGAVAALTGPQDSVATMFTAFEERQTYMYETLNAMPGISCARPEGAFFAFPNVQEYFGKSVGDITINSSADLALYLLEQGKIATVAGEGFGTPGYIRISYAASMTNIERGLARMQDALAQLQ